MMVGSAAPIWVLAILVLVALPDAVAQVSKSPLSQKLDQVVDACTEGTGFDRAAAAKLGDHELGALEKPWRECIYQGLRKRLLPSMSNPQALERAIEQDKRFTAAIENGEMTRTERWQENRAAVQMAFLEEDLARAEQQQRMQGALDEAQRTIDDEMQIMHSVIRGFRR